MLVFLVMYRDRPGRRARYTHGNTTLEIVWTVVPALILVILAFLSVPTWSKIKMSHPPPSDFVLQVTAKQFNWEVPIPGPDGKFGTGDDKTCTTRCTCRSTRSCTSISGPRTSSTASSSRSSA